METNRNPIQWEVNHIYYDNDGFKYGFGDQIWKSKKDIQYYTGNFLLDFYHTYGKYKWIENTNKIVYEGSFFANCKDGYGIMSYANGFTFEGLFKNDRRFGPGVLTYSRDSQDVGFWLGSQIARLITPHSVIPRLATTEEGKVKVLQFRALISLPEDKQDIANSILTEMGVSHRTDISNKFYSKFIRNPRSLFFNNPLFYCCFFEGFTKLKDFYLNTSLLNDNDELCKQETSEVPTEDKISILAWNNEEYAIDILKHCYLHNKFEELVTFKVDELLRGNRSHFYNPGPIETLNVELLLKCARPDPKPILQYLYLYNLSPDVRDSLGNSPVMIAAAHDHCSTITELAKVAANINSINDEGLTPVGLCLLRYLAVLYDVKNWENAFLPPGIHHKLKNKGWRTKNLHKDYSKDSALYPGVFKNDASGVEVRSISKSKKPSFLKNDDSNQKFIFKFPFTWNQEAEKDTMENKIYQAVVLEKLSKSGKDELMREITTKLDKINHTILTLLESGAGVRNILQVPRSFLFLALFCHNRNIVEGLLKAGSDPNDTIPPEEGKLAPLHVICLLPPNKNTVAVVQLLLNYNANPNASANPVWYQQLSKEWHIELSQEPFQSGQVIITPLQILILRPDLLVKEEKRYFCEIAHLLVPVTTPDILFFGHTPLSTTILRRDPDMMSCLLLAGADPNVELSENLGTNLAVLLHLDNFNTDLSMQMLELLIENGIDILHPIRIDGVPRNIIDFANIHFGVLLKSILEVKPEKAKKAKKSDKEVSEKELLMKKVEAYENCVRRLKSVIEGVIIRHIKGNLTRLVIQKAMAEIDKIPFTSDTEVTQAQKYLTIDEFFNCLEIHMNHGIKMYKEDIINGLIILNNGKLNDEEFMNSIESKDFKSKIHVKERPKPVFITGRKKLDIYHTTFNKPSFLKKCQKSAVHFPELERDNIKYNVCFNCFRSPVEAMKCPTCQLTTFCLFGCEEDMFVGADDENVIRCGICGVKNSYNRSEVGKTSWVLDPVSLCFDNSKEINKETKEQKISNEQNILKEQLAQLKEKDGKIRTDKKGISGGKKPSVKGRSETPGTVEKKGKEKQELTTDDDDDDDDNKKEPKGIKGRKYSEAKKDKLIKEKFKEGKKEKSEEGKMKGDQEMKANKINEQESEKPKDKQKKRKVSIDQSKKGKETKEEIADEEKGKRSHENKEESLKQQKKAKISLDQKMSGKEIADEVAQKVSHKKDEGSEKLHKKEKADLDQMKKGKETADEVKKKQLHEKDEKSAKLHKKEEKKSPEKESAKSRREEISEKDKRGKHTDTPNEREKIQKPEFLDKMPKTGQDDSKTIKQKSKSMALNEKEKLFNIGELKTEGTIYKGGKSYLAGKEFAEALLKSLLEKTGLNLELMLPYVVLRDGFLYYKLYGKEPSIKENYSFI